MTTATDFPILRGCEGAVTVGLQASLESVSVGSHHCRFAPCVVNPWLLRPEPSVELGPGGPFFRLTIREGSVRELHERSSIPGASWNLSTLATLRPKSDRNRNRHESDLAVSPIVQKENLLIQSFRDHSIRALIIFDLNLDSDGYVLPLRLR